MHNMYKMIKEQPEAIGYTIEHCNKTADEASKLLEGKRVYLTGCGSSFHAALYGEFVLREFGFDAAAIHALDLIHYTPDLKNSVAMVISHSWKARTTLKAVDVIQQNGIPCVGLTANAKAKKDVDLLLRTSNYYDSSDCVTMGYTTKLAALATIAERAKGRKQLDKVPNMITKALETEPQVKELVNKYSKHQRFFILGAGPNSATAYEMALKMKEGNFTDAEGMQIEQMLHGSLSGVDDSDIVFIIAPKGSKTRQRAYEAVRAFNKIEATTIAVTDSDKEITKEAEHTIEIPTCDEYLSPLISIVPLQLFAYFFADKHGVNPDMTREEDARYRRAYATVLLHFK